MATIDYTIPQYPTSRLRYFNNQFLVAQDFIDEQAATVGRERVALRSLCVAGVLDDIPFSNLTPAKFQLGPGTAVDRYGRLIAIEAAIDGPLPGGVAPGDYVVSLAWSEVEDKMATAGSGGAPGNTRWLTKPVVTLVAKSTALPDGAIAIGAASVATGGAFATGSPTAAGREYSGLRLPGTSATLARNGNGNAGLTGSLDISGAAAVGGVLTVTGASTLNGALTVAGASSLNGALTVAGATKLNGGLTVAGATSVTGGLSVSGALAANGIVASGLTVSGALAANGGLTVSGALAANGGLTVSGALAANGGVTVSGVLAANGGLAVTGAATVSTSVTAGTLLTTNGALRLGMSNWVPYGADGTIVVDQPNYHALMIVGSNQNQGHNRWIRMWDDVQVEGGLTVKGAITPSVGNGAGAGIYFPTNPGGGGGDEAFLRYYVTSGETTKLMLGINNDGDDTIGLWQAGAERLTIFNGAVGIGTANPVGGHGELTCSGPFIHIRGAGGEQIYIGGDGAGNDVQIGSENAAVMNVACYNPHVGYMDIFYRNPHATSDQALKKHIEPIEDPLAAVRALRAVSFRWNHEPDDVEKTMGVIAQEVQRVLPGVVRKATRGVLTVNYNALTALLLDAVREQDARIDAIERKLADGAKT